MTSFLIRFAIYAGLWILMIAQSNASVSISILFFAVSLGIYFFLSIRNIPLFVYIILTIIIGLHGFLIQESVLTMLIFLSISMTAMFRLKVFNFSIYLTFVTLLSILLRILLGESVLIPLIVTFFFSFLASTLNKQITENNEQKMMYERLVSEYGQLKRMNVSSEKQARLEERTRIARDIHDSVGHRLTALIMTLEMLAIQKGDSDLRKVKQMAVESLEETREAVKALQASESEGIATVVHLIRKLEAESHMLIRFTLKEGVLSVPLSNEQSVVLYRVIQEALTNAMRHAQTREVHVTLGKSSNGNVTFNISNPYQAKKGIEFGFGLTNMKNRVEELDGRLDVYQTENHFIVKGVIPGE